MLLRVTIPTRRNFNIKRIAILFTILILSLSLSTASASSIGAYNIKITSKYVMATAKCSCSLSTDYKHHTRVFYNYDPVSHKYGVLAFESGPASYTSPEGRSKKYEFHFKK